MQSTYLETLAARSAHAVLVSATLINLAVLSQAQSTTTPYPHNPPAAARPTHPGGQHEGIKVHGHWTIEIKNPNGNLVSHTEFENSLASGGNQLLSALLLGSDVTGGYRVDVASSATQGIGPCAATNGGHITKCLLVGSLITPGPTTFSEVGTGCGFSSSAENPITATGPCFPLGISYGANNASLTFSGTAVAQTTSAITDVFLESILCPLTGNTVGGATIAPNSCAQQAGGASPLTHATLATPVQITAAGQSIAVTVQLSFQ